MNKKSDLEAGNPRGLSAKPQPNQFDHSGTHLVGRRDIKTEMRLEELQAKFEQIAEENARWKQKVSIS